MRTKATVLIPMLKASSYTAGSQISPVCTSIDFVRRNASFMPFHRVLVYEAVYISLGSKHLTLYPIIYNILLRYFIVHVTMYNNYITSKRRPIEHLRSGQIHLPTTLHLQGLSPPKRFILQASLDNAQVHYF